MTFYKTIPWERIPPVGTNLKAKWRKRLLSGFTPTLVDSLYQRPLIEASGGGGTVKPMGDGPAVYLTGTGKTGYIGTAFPAGMSVASDMTYVAMGVQETTSGAQTFVNVGDTLGFAHILRMDGTALNFYTYRDSSFDQATIAGVGGANTRIVAAATMRGGGTNIALAARGFATNSVGATAGPNSLDNSHYGYGDRGANEVFQGWINFVFCFEGGTQSNELEWIVNNPYAELFEPRRIWVPGGFVAGGASTPLPGKSLILTRVANRRAANW